MMTSRPTLQLYVESHSLENVLISAASASHNVKLPPDSTCAKRMLPPSDHPRGSLERRRRVRGEVIHVRANDPFDRDEYV